MADIAWPVEIRLQGDRRRLEIDYEDGRSYVLPAELLRVESPSAEVQQHGGEKVIVAGKRAVAIREVETVGNYAVRLVFDDGHDTGIYTWTYLRELGEDQEQVFRRYLAALERLGRGREP